MNEHEPNKRGYVYFSTKTYVVGTQKNRLETVLLSTHNICFSQALKNKSKLFAHYLGLSGA